MDYESSPTNRSEANGIEDEGANYLAKALAQNTSLTHLDISGMYNIFTKAYLGAHLEVQITTLVQTERWDWLR